MWLPTITKALLPTNLLHHLLAEAKVFINVLSLVLYCNLCSQGFNAGLHRVLKKYVLFCILYFLTKQQKHIPEMSHINDFSSWKGNTGSLVVSVGGTLFFVLFQPL